MTKKTELIARSVVMSGALMFIIFVTVTKPKVTPVQPPSIEREVTLLAIESSDKWHGLLLPEDKAEIQSRLDASDDAGALERIKAAIYDGVTRDLIKGGHIVEEERWGWNNNNGVTVLLFINFPLAQRLGREREMIAEYQTQGRWGSIMQNISNEQWQKFAAWRQSGQWPFEGEEAPIYKRHK